MKPKTRHNAANSLLKKMVKSITNFCLLILFFTVTATADNISRPGVEISSGIPLSEQEIINSALENSDKLKSLTTNTEIAKYRYKSIQWLQNPELRFGEETLDNPDKDKIIEDLPYNFSEVKAGLRLRFPELGEIRKEKQQALVNIVEKQIEEFQYRQRVIARIKKNFAKVIMYDNLVDLALQRVEKENERIKIIEQMVNLGNRSVVYFTKAKMWHAESKTNYTQTVQNQKLARRILARRSGIAENSLLLTNEMPAVTQDLDTLISLAYQYRPEIRLVQNKIALAIRKKNMEKFKLVPWINFAEYSYHKQNDGDKWKEFSVGISLPIFNWNRGNIKATKLAVTKKQGELSAIQESIAEEVRSAYIIYRDLFIEWRDFKKNADEMLINVNEVIDQAKQHETLFPDEVLEMELTAIETQKILFEKKKDVMYALIDLFLAIGIESNECLNIQD